MKKVFWLKDVLLIFSFMTLGKKYISWVLIHKIQTQDLQAFRETPLILVLLTPFQPQRNRKNYCWHKCNQNGRSLLFIKHLKPFFGQNRNNLSSFPKQFIVHNFGRKYRFAASLGQNKVDGLDTIEFQVFKVMDFIIEFVKGKFL